MTETDERPDWIAFISKALTLDAALEKYALWEKSQLTVEGEDDK